MTTATDRSLNTKYAHCMFPHFAGFTGGNKAELALFLFTPGHQYLTPRIKPTTGEWALHPRGAMAANSKALAMCERRLYEVFSKYTIDSKDTNPLAQIIKRMTEVDKKLYDYLHTNKDTLETNDANVRYILIDALRGKLSQCNAEERPLVEEKLTDAVAFYAEQMRSELNRLPFKPATDNADEFSGFDLFSEVISDTNNTGFETIAKDKATVVGKLKSQATAANNTVLGCMRMTRQYIEAFTTTTGLTVPGSTVHTKWRTLLLTKSDNNLQHSEPELLDREQRAKDRLVSCLLAELFEIMSCHAFIFFNQIIGKSQKKVDPFVNAFVGDWIRYCLTPLFWYDSDLRVSSNGHICVDTFADPAHKTSHIVSRRVSQLYTAFDKTFVTALDTMLAYQPETLSSDALSRLRTSINAQLGTSIPITIDKLKVFDFHLEELLQKVEQTYTACGIIQGREDFQTMLKGFKRKPSDVFAHALRMPDFEPDAQFNHFLDNLNETAKVEIKLKDAAGPNPEEKVSLTYTQLYGMLLVYASKRHNPLFAGRYLLGKIKSSTKLEAARAYLLKHNVFWVKAAEAGANPGTLKDTDLDLAFSTYDLFQTPNSVSASVTGANATLKPIVELFKFKSKAKYAVPRPPPPVKSEQPHPEQKQQQKESRRRPQSARGGPRQARQAPQRPSSARPPKKN